MTKVRYIVGTLKEEKFIDVSVIHHAITEEHAIKEYNKINKGITYPVWVIARIDENGLDIYDDSSYYVEKDSYLKLLLESLATEQ